MHLTFRPVLLRIAAACLLIVVAGCDSNGVEPIYDEDRDFRPDPMITSISPEGEALSGVGTITITGENFSADPADVQVFFAGELGEVISASPTSIEVRPPLVDGEDLPLKVSVTGAENFATEPYTLRPAVEPFGMFSELETPISITTDEVGNVYVSYLTSGTPDGIIEITPEGERSQYVPAQSWPYSDMAFGPDNALYAVRGLAPIIYRAPSGGGEAEVWLFVEGFPALGTLDFDASGNIWAGGDNDAIYRVGLNETVASFPFAGNVRSLRVFGGHLYAAVTRDSVSSIWRAPMSGGDLGSFEEYFDFSAQVGTGGITHALAFAQDGTMYVGTDGPHGIVTVSPNGTWQPYYPGLFNPAITTLVWGNDPFLYAVRRPTEAALADDSELTDTILKINTQKQGAH